MSEVKRLSDVFLIELNLLVVVLTLSALAVIVWRDMRSPRDGIG